MIVTPTAPTTAFRIGEKTTDPLQMYLSDIFTISVNLAGLPGLSLPCGFDAAGLPIGLQIVGRPFDEATRAARGLRLRAGDRVAPRRKPESDHGGTRHARQSSLATRALGVE